jgi:hypothetical protein
MKKRYIAKHAGKVKKDGKWVADQTLKKPENRVSEIKGMTDKQLVWALCASAGWEYAARRDMDTEFADNLYKDMELMKHEVLKRMASYNTH